MKPDAAVALGVPVPEIEGPQPFVVVPAVQYTTGALRFRSMRTNTWAIEVVVALLARTVATKYSSPLSLSSRSSLPKVLMNRPSSNRPLPSRSTGAPSRHTTVWLLSTNTPFLKVFALSVTPAMA